jgi:hypothetical protein
VLLGTGGRLDGRLPFDPMSDENGAVSEACLALNSGELGTEVAGDISLEDEFARVNESRSLDGLFGDEESDDVDVLMVLVNGLPRGGCCTGISG